MYYGSSYFNNPFQCPVLTIFWKPSFECEYEELSVSVSRCGKYENGIIVLECECDGVRVSARRWNECDKVALGDSSLKWTSYL